MHDAAGQRPAGDDHVVVLDGVPVHGRVAADVVARVRPRRVPVSVGWPVGVQLRADGTSVAAWR